MQLHFGWTEWKTSLIYCINKGFLRVLPTPIYRVENWMPTSQTRTTKWHRNPNFKVYYLLQDKAFQNFNLFFFVLVFGIFICIFKFSIQFYIYNSMVTVAHSSAVNTRDYFLPKEGKSTNLICCLLSQYWLIFLMKTLKSMKF